MERRRRAHTCCQRSPVCITLVGNINYPRQLLLKEPTSPLRLLSNFNSVCLITRCGNRSSRDSVVRSRRPGRVGFVSQNRCRVEAVLYSDLILNGLYGKDVSLNSHSATSPITSEQYLTKTNNLLTRKNSGKLKPNSC